MGGTIVVNGGNCLWNDVNWVHYVHNTPMAERGRPSLPRRKWLRWKRRRDQRREGLAVGESRLVVTDSELMKARLIAGTSIEPGAYRRSIMESIRKCFVPPATASGITGVNSWDYRWTGPWLPSLVHLASTAARASMCFSTRGADAARTRVGTRR